MDAWLSGRTPENDVVVDELRRAVEECPDRLYLDFEGDRHTYADVWTSACELARGLRELGVGPGQTVVSMLDNNVDGVRTWIASNLVGAIWVGVNTALKGEFLRHVVSDAGARVVLCEHDFVERFLRLEDKLPDVEWLLVRGEKPEASADAFRVDQLDAHRLAGSDEQWVKATPDDVTCLVYTGGTTGPSKGCIISNGYAFNSGRAFLQQSGRTPDEVNFSPLPMFHFNLVSGTILSTMVLRSTAAVGRKFSVSRFWPEMERTGARMVNLLGSMSVMIARMDDTPEMQRCFGQIRVLHGAPIPPDIRKIWHERFGVAKVGADTYGQTEAFPQTTLEVGTPAPPGSSGKKHESFDIRIFDDDDNELGPGEVGEIVIRPRKPNVMFKGYWRRPEATVAAMGNMWFHTGDLGRFDEEGFFYFVDRKKDYLRYRSENISSQELEAAYLLHPDVAEVAVHAVLSTVTEDDVKVTAVLRPGATLTEEALFEWSKEHVPYFALPRYIEFRTELPLSPLGRVHKYRLRDEGCTPATWDREQAGVTWERR